MRTKTIFFDIDGTLYDHDKQIPATTKEAIRKLRELGHNIAIATGRAPFMFEGLRRELGIDSYISLNGQYVVYEGQVIYQNPIDRSTLKNLTLFAEDKDHPVAYMDDKAMKLNIEHHVDVETSMGTLKFDVPEHDPEYYQSHDIYQAMVFCAEDYEEAYRKEYPALRFVRWHPVCMDVLPGIGSKAHGIAQMLNFVGTDKADTYAFGDGLNDIEMLQFVGHGIAMGNAHDEVKRSASFVTKNVDEDGIWFGLHHMGLL